MRELIRLGGNVDLDIRGQGKLSGFSPVLQIISIRLLSLEIHKENCTLAIDKLQRSLGEIKNLFGRCWKHGDYKILVRIKGRNPASHLENHCNISKIEDKTEECVLVGIINCLPDTAFGKW